MISAWKKLINRGELNEQTGAVNKNGRDNVTANANFPPGCQKLDKELQKKFARGVHYNLKVVIKGDAKTGKSSLFARLKGQPFNDDYEPTENLNVTSIDWGYKTTDDVVKIDIWEVVDGTSHRTAAVDSSDLKLASDNKSDQHTKGDTISSLKLTMNNNSKLPDGRQSLAEMIGNLDVYRGTDAVILLMDMTKLWTYKYVQNELPKIPKQIPVLVVANFRDQGHHRCVSSEQVKAFIGTLDRDPSDGIVMYSEASMRNGFGMKLIERYLNIPFLRVQELSLLKQLELNRQEYLTTREELDFMRESIDIEYEQYLELQTIMRRKQADATSPVNLGPRQLDEAVREQIRNSSASSELTENKNNALKSLESNPNAEKSAAQLEADKKFVNNRLPSIVIGAKCPLPEHKALQVGSVVPPNQKEPTSEETSPEAVEIDGESSDDEDNESRANPLVAGYQSDLDPDDQ